MGAPLRHARLAVAAVALAALAAAGAPPPRAAAKAAAWALASVEEADRLLLAGEYGRAIDLYRSLALEEPRGAPAARFRLAAAHLKRDEAAAALEVSAEVVAARPTADAYALRSLARFRAGRFGDAEGDRDRALDRSPRESRLAHFADARLLASSGRYREALGALEATLESSAFADRLFRADALLLRAESLDALGRFAEAADAHDEALRVMPRTNELRVANLTAQAAFRRSALGRELFRVAPDRGSARVKFSIHRGLPVVEVSVNGAKPAPFAVDTGAGVCVLFADYARQIGFRTRDEQAWAGAVGGDGRVAIRYGLADRVALGAAEVENVPMAVVEAGIPHLAGLVGLPLLRRFLTTFDYREAELRLERAGEPGAAREPGRRDAARGEAPFRLVGNTLFVETWVGGQGPFNFALDTGAGPTSVPVEPSVAAALGLSPSDGRRARAVGAAGTHDAVVYRGARVSWAGLPAVSVDLMSQLITPARPERRQGESGLVADAEIEGLVGYALLGRSVLTLDFAARRLAVR